MSSNPTAGSPAHLSPLDRFVAILNAFGSLWVLGIVLLICTDSFGRSFFNKPFDGVNEIVAVSMAFVVFCQLADTIRLDKLTRSDSFLPRLQASRSLLARLVVCSFDVLGMAIMIAIIIGTVPLLIESIERGYFVGEAGIFTFPDWPIKAMVVFGSIMATLCFGVRALAHWRASGRDEV
ncbi:MAG: TRAP transporter small permease [Pseudolabrys sp.]|nr:TRAP transporter small permease [Pseudolabrys sp.]